MPRTGGGGSRRGFRFPRQARIRSGTEIRALLRGGRRWRWGPLEVFVADSPSDLPRYGTIVPKYGRRIVDRNRLRRRLRELGRTEVLPRLVEADRALDVLVRVRRDAYSAPFNDLRTELIRLTESLCSDVSPSD